MKKWLIGCLTVLAMVCLIPGIALNAKAESLYCRYCDKFTDCEILGYKKYDSSFHTLHIKCKSCKMENDVIDSNYSSHEWSKWESLSGMILHGHSCNRCGYYITEVCTGGTATCTAKAVCVVCGGEYGKLAPHSLVTIDRPATCQKEGLRYTYCAACRYRTPNIITPIQPHDLKKAREFTREPTCTKPGWNSWYLCQTCTYSETDWVDKLGHDFVHHDAQAATCTKPGWSAYETCSRCNYTTYAEQAALNHNLEQHAAKAPTCTEIGWDAYETCSRCDHTTYAELPALNHALEQHAAQAPTCTEIGWNAYETCSRCDYTTYAELPALNHDYQAVTVDPTCEADGYTVFTCSRCKDSYTADPTDKLGHQFGAWSPNGTGSQSAGCLRQGCAHIGSTDCRKFTFRTAEGETLTFCPVCGQAENAAQLEKIEAATAWALSGSLSAEDVTARTNGEYLSVAFETAGSLTQPTGRVRLALPAGLLEGKKLVRIAPDGTQTELPFETKDGKIIFTLDFANSELPVMLFRLVPQTAAL